MNQNGKNPKASRDPSVPVKVYVNPGDGMASILFQAPEKNGGGKIPAYFCTVYPGGRKVNFSGRPVICLGGKHSTFCIVDGLGISYIYGISEVNSAGVSEELKTSDITPAAYPASKYTSNSLH